MVSSGFNNVTLIVISILLIILVAIGVIIFYNKPGPDKTINADLYVAIDATEKPQSTDNYSKIHKPTATESKAEIVVSDTEIENSTIGSVVSSANSLETLIAREEVKFDPNPDVQKYLNIPRARRYVARISNKPAEFERYKLSVHDSSKSIISKYTTYNI